MPDPNPAATDTAAPSPAFVPEPLPPSTFANAKAMMGVVALKYPVVFEGKTWSEIYLRVFTTAQVATVIRNYDRRLKIEPDAPFSFPVYVDADGNDVPEGLVQQLAQDDVDDLQERAGDFLPRRFRPLKSATADTANGAESLNASDLTSGGPTEASSAG